MPGAKKNYSKKAKPYKSKYKKKSKSVTLYNNSSLQPVASRWICKQKYSDTFSITVLQPTYTFNLNSVYDPNRTGIGHQPYGFDTMATLYNRYRVIGCSYNINMWNSSSAVRCVAICANEVPAFATISEVCENPRATWKNFVPGGSPVLLNGYCSIPKLTGRTKSQYMADDRYQALTTASPNELAILYITAANLADSTIDGTLFTITMEYTVEYFDPKNLSQS